MTEAGVIDPGKIPSRVAFDSSVLTLTREGLKEEPAPLCRALMQAIFRKGSSLLLAAPVVAEYIRHPTNEPLPRRRGVEVVSFDDVAARLLATFPPHIFIDAKAAGTSKHYVKYDSLIVACAKRHRADVLVTRDDKQATLAKTVGLNVMGPEDFRVVPTTLPLFESDW